MSGLIGDIVLDNGLLWLNSHGTVIHICAGAPTTYAEVLSKSLGSKTFAAGAGWGSPYNGSGGRAIDSSAIVDGVVTASGTADNWASIDGSSNLLATNGLIAPVAVTAGGNFALGTMTVTMPLSGTVGDVKIFATVADIGLSALDANCDRIHACGSGAITSYANVTSLSLGSKAFTRGAAFGSPAAGSGGGRIATSVAITDGSVTTSGTFTQWAAVDSTLSDVLAVGAIAGSTIG